jgi:hypothetical protein
MGVTPIHADDRIAIRLQKSGMRPPSIGAARVSAEVEQGTESSLTPKRAEDLEQMLPVPRGLFASSATPSPA